MLPMSGAQVQSQIVLRSHGGMREIILNRPEALNALSLDMIMAMRSVLVDYENDSNVSCVVVRGAGARGFCAGGDIRRIYKSLNHPDGWPAQMWAEEYALNALIAGYLKPYVVLMDGIVMGGGIGISAHGNCRIVTEKTAASMPEVGIGLIPDAGGTWLLSRAPGEIGTYLALTGTTIGAADSIYAGLADLFVRSVRLDELVAELASLELPVVPGEVRSVICKYQEATTVGKLEKYRDVIDRCLAFDTVEDILRSLDSSETEFGIEAANLIRGKSPTSLKVTLKLLRSARDSASLKECLRREYSAVLHAAEIKHELLEGIRAAVIDKDRKPKWCPDRLSDVSNSDVMAYIDHETTRDIPFQLRKS